MLQRRCALLLAVGVSLFAVVHSIPINNGVQGDPEIECGPTSIGINFNTQNNFEGHVYVKNRFAEPTCRNSEVGRRIAGIELDFSTCGVKRERSANPKGIFVTTTVVITFHPRFITKIDRAYTVQCFYMEADKTVSADIEVSMITTGFETQFVPMPVCRYEILDGTPSSPPVSVALIGQKVYHKWTCDTETVDTFCMLVHTCFVDDGQQDRFDLLDTEGCARDANLLDNLDYPTDLMAGQEAHVFKYADRPQLFFQCQITITVKEPDQKCPLPDCGNAPFTLGRKKREVFDRYVDVTTVDVSTRNLQILDIDDLPADFPPHLRTGDHHILSDTTTNARGVCFSHVGFTLMLSALVIAVFSVIMTVVYATFKRM